MNPHVPGIGIPGYVSVAPSGQVAACTCFGGTVEERYRSIYRFAVDALLHILSHSMDYTMITASSEVTATQSSHSTRRANWYRNLSAVI